MATQKVDWTAINARLELIGEILQLDESDIDKAKTTDEALIDFAEQHNQSLEWIIRGRLDTMICELSTARRDTRWGRLSSL